MAFCVVDPASQLMEVTLHQDTAVAIKTFGFAEGSRSTVAFSQDVLGGHSVLLGPEVILPSGESPLVVSQEPCAITTIDITYSAVSSKWTASNVRRYPSAIEAIREDRRTRNFFFSVCAYNQSDFAAISALGITHVRMDVPTQANILAARELGIEVIPIAAYGYADLSGNGNAAYPPTAPNRATWATRMVDRWRSLAVPPVAVEVWNEPWSPGFWPPAPSPSAYLALVQAFAAEAWAVWPNMKLLVCGDAFGPYPTWTTELLAADTGNLLADPRIFPTCHPYVEDRWINTVASGRQWDFTKYIETYDAFKAHGHPDPQVWVTEFGWESDNVSPGFANNTPITEAEQSIFVLDALEAMRRSRKVQMACMFLMKSNDPWNYNVLRPNNTVKPVGFAIQAYQTTAR